MSFHFLYPYQTTVSAYPKICIEHYYQNNDILNEDDEGRRVFLNSEFNKELFHQSIPSLFAKKHKKFMDKDPELAFVFRDDIDPTSESLDLVLSKSRFARYVLDRRGRFDKIDFSSFRKVFDIIQAIINDISLLSSKAELITAYNLPPLAIAPPPLLDSGNRYQVVHIKDNSHGNAKRFTADLLINSELTKPELIQIIRAETEILKQFQSSDDVLRSSVWHGKSAQVIWLSLFESIDDLADYNPICQSIWVSDDLSSAFSPLKAKSDDEIDGIEITWSKNSDSVRNTFNRVRVDARKYLDGLKDIVSRIHPKMRHIMQLTEDLSQSKILEKQYIEEVGPLSIEISNLEKTRQYLGQPPLALSPLKTKFNSLVDHASNVAHPFSVAAVNRWSPEKRQFIVIQQIKYYQNAYRLVEAELDKYFDN